MKKRNLKLDLLIKASGICLLVSRKSEELGSKLTQLGFEELRRWKEETSNQ